MGCTKIVPRSLRRIRQGGSNTERNRQGETQTVIRWGAGAVVVHGALLRDIIQPGATVLAIAFAAVDDIVRRAYRYRYSSKPNVLDTDSELQPVIRNRQYHLFGLTSCEF